MAVAQETKLCRICHKGISAHGTWEFYTVHTPWGREPYWQHVACEEAQYFVSAPWLTRLWRRLWGPR